MEELCDRLQLRIWEAEGRIRDLERAIEKTTGRRIDLELRIERPPYNWTPNERGQQVYWPAQQLEDLKHRARRCGDRVWKLKDAIAKTAARLEVLRARLASIPDKVAA